MNDFSQTSYEPAPPDTPDSVTAAQEIMPQDDSCSGEGGLAVLLCAVAVLAGPLALEWWVYWLAQGGAS